MIVRNVLLEAKETIHDKNYSNSRFSIPLLWIEIAADVSGPVILVEKGTLVHPSI